MRYLIIIFLVIFSFNSHSDTLESVCNDSLKFLNTVGFNYNKLHGTQKKIKTFTGISCGWGDNRNLIQIYTKPQFRLFVFDEDFPMSKGGYCVYVPSGKKFYVSNNKDCL